MWTYSQSTGALSRDGKQVGSGYSGNGIGFDNPDEQSVSKVGPLPQGLYGIGPAFTHPTKGPVVMRLIPDMHNNEFGRGNFLFHGDNSAMNHTASEGCVILARPLRTMIAASSDRELTVTA